MRTCDERWRNALLSVSCYRPRGHDGLHGGIVQHEHAVMWEPEGDLLDRYGVYRER